MAPAAAAAMRTAGEGRPRGGHQALRRGSGPLLLGIGQMPLEVDTAA
jgi:hypothetical protein